jgi:hypothetical protein
MQNKRIKCAWVWVITVLLGFAATSSTEVLAGIASTSGDIEVVAPPASVQPQAYENSSEIRVFLESEQTISSVPVNAVLPGTYHAYSDFVDQTLVPNGPIDSYFIHYDVIGQTLAQASGSITFDEPILAVIGRSLTLQQTDGTLGALGTLYPTSRFDRELEYETRGNYDFFRLDPDGHAIFVQVEDSTDVDQIRVITAAPEPSTMTLALVSATLPFSISKLMEKHLQRHGNLRM